MLYWYSHRLSSHDPDVFQENLARAKSRRDYLRPSFAARGIVLWAPWIEIADGGIDESTAWELIGPLVCSSDGIVLDLDGTDEPSHGMVRERTMAEELGAKVEVVR